MLRVVFDTRLDVGGTPTLARLEKRICPQDLHMADATIGDMIRRMGREDWLAPHITPKE